MFDQSHNVFDEMPVGQNIEWSQASDHIFVVNKLWLTKKVMIQH